VIIASGVLGATLVAMLVPGATAEGTGHRSASIVCPGIQPCCGPVLGVRADVVPCCPVPTDAPCCAPVLASACCATVTCPSALAIAASPNPASEGKEATITGTLTGPTVVAQTVDLYERLAGQASFANVAHAQTNLSGAFSFTRAVTTNGEWYATAANNVQSPTIAESVLAAVVLKPSSTHPKAGAKLKLSGTILPSHAGERVALQRLRRGRWVTVARPKLGAHSRFAVTEKMSARGAARFRVVLAADARNARSVSGVVAITAR